MIAHICAALRIAQLVPWPIAMVVADPTGLERVWLAVLAYAVQTVWSITWAGLVIDRRRIPAWTMAIDVPVAALCLVLAGLACYPHDAVTWANSAVTPAMGTAVAAAAALPLVRSAPSLTLLAGAYLIGVSPALRRASTAWTVATANVCAMVGFAIVAGLAAGYLTRQARSAAAIADELAAARRRLAAEDARERDRARQYRMLHDTVLSTLSALARGGLDPTDPLVRQRCAADADYLRGLIASGGVSGGSRLQAELAVIGRSQAGVGLRVHLHCADLPADLPADVVQASSNACREALNNVIKHSGADQAWVTAVGGDDGGTRGEAGFTLTITDRGRGFAPDTTAPGLGLRESIGARMAEVGGAMQVDSSPGQGTSVELRWPA